MLITLANVVTEIMSFLPEKVIVGRDNILNNNFSDDIIVVDYLTPPSLIGNSRGYDDVNEKETHYTTFEAKTTLEFYGANSKINAYKFIGLQNTQVFRDLQKKYNLSIFKASSINNLKQKKGNRYYDRIEIEIMVQYTDSVTVNLLRMDSIPLSYTNKG